MTAPLEGLKVIEMARILAGPRIGQTLADLGADVIKLESPGGDDTRNWGPPFVKRADGSVERRIEYHGALPASAESSYYRSGESETVGSERSRERFYSAPQRRRNPRSIHDQLWM